MSLLSPPYLGDLVFDQVGEQGVAEVVSTKNEDVLEDVPAWVTRPKAQPHSTRKRCAKGPLEDKP